MSCDLVTTLSALRCQASSQPVLGAVSCFLSRTRQIRLPYSNGCHMLFRGLTAETIDYGYPVGVSITGSPITESLTSREVSTGDLVYAVRAHGPGGMVDDADPVETVALTFVDDVVQHPAPAPPINVSIKPYAGGKVKVVGQVNNNNADVPAKSVVVFSDGGTGTGVDWETPVTDPQFVSDGYGDFAIVFDPGLAHGSTIVVGVRTRSKYDVDSVNTNTQSAVVDSQGPTAISMTVTEVTGE